MLYIFYSDITITCEGTVIPAHKVILAARSVKRFFFHSEFIFDSSIALPHFLKSYSKYLVRGAFLNWGGCGFFQDFDNSDLPT